MKWFVKFTWSTKVNIQKRCNLPKSTAYVLQILIILLASKQAINFFGIFISLFVCLFVLLCFVLLSLPFLSYWERKYVHFNILSVYQFYISLFWHVNIYLRLIHSLSIQVDRHFMWIWSCPFPFLWITRWWLWEIDFHQLQEYLLSLGSQNLSPFSEKYLVKQLS